MSKNSFNIIAAMQRWMDSVPGQTFLNYAYSWGASIVILGALFKLTHIAGANFMLFLGMGTEVIVFFLSAFDRPFDKDEIDKALPEDPDLLGEDEDEETEDNEENEHEAETVENVPAGGTVIGTAAGGAGGGTVIIGGGTGTVGGGEQQGGNVPTGGTVIGGGGVVGGVIGGVIGGFAGVGGGSAAGTQQVAENAPAENAAEGTKAPAAPNAQVTSEQVSNLINAANAEMLAQAKTAISPEMEEATKSYVEELKQLTDVLNKVSEQSVRLTRDSEEMEQLNRTLTGINTIYEMQLKSISTQVGTIDQINDQTRRMAKQIEELNGVYSRMIKALTVNMKNAASASGAITEE